MDLTRGIINWKLLCFHGSNMILLFLKNKEVSWKILHIYTNHQINERTKTLIDFLMPTSVQENDISTKRSKKEVNQVGISTFITL